MSRAVSSTAAAVITIGASSSRPAPRDSPLVDRASEVERRGEVEVCGHRLLEHGRRPTAVLAPGGGADRGEADVVPAAPVAGDVTECRKPHVPSVRRHADTVHAGATGDGDAPAALGACSQHGERVVPDARPSSAQPHVSNAARATSSSSGKSSPASMICARPARPSSPSLVDQVLEGVDAACKPEMVR